MNDKKYYNGRKEKFKSKKSNRFTDYNSFYNEPEEYLIEKEYDFSLKQHVIKRVLLNNFIFFGVLIVISFMLYYIYKYVN